MSRGAKISMALAVAGLALLTAVLGYVGFPAVVGATVRIGLDGFLVFVAYWLFIVSALGLAWFTVAPGTPVRRAGVFVWGRLLREAASDILPFSQVGALLISVRAITARHVAERLAWASTLVDLTTEMAAQVLFVVAGVAGLALQLHLTRAAPGVLWAVLAGLAALLAIMLGFLFAQRRGIAWIGGLVQRWLPDSVARADAVRVTLDDIYRRPGRLAGGVAFHTLGWVAAAFGSWIALEFMGEGLPLWKVLTLESLMCAVRSVAFAVPGALGVQEGAYVVIGLLFGLSPQDALALSLLKRARDLVIGAPALVIWQMMEGRRLLRPSL
jgi:putative membrane protein